VRRYAHEAIGPPKVSWQRIAGKHLSEYPDLDTGHDVVILGWMIFKGKKEGI
jgi:hypothetical protein